MVDDVVARARGLRVVVVFFVDVRRLGGILEWSWYGQVGGLGNVNVLRPLNDICQ